MTSGIAAAPAATVPVAPADELSMITETRMRPAAAAPEDLASLIERFNRIDHVAVEEEEHEEKLDVSLSDGPDLDAPVVRLVHQILAEAVKLGVSDIHCNP